MKMQSEQTRLDDFGRIQDMVANLLPTTEPFLYYVPSLLKQESLQNVQLPSVINLASKAQQKERDPIISDALRILNQLVDPHTGALIEPHASFFMDNTHFFWNELGGHTTSAAVIQHILNKLLFLNTLENQ